MADLNIGLESAPSVMERVIAATPRVLLGAAFVIIGWTKFDSHSLWVRVFREIGLGQWLRYLAGLMQFGGGILALFRRTALIGATLIACTMAGAVLTDLFVLRYGIVAIIPLILFVCAAGVAYQAWANAS